MKTHKTNKSDSPEHGATVVISHRVQEGKHSDYEAWLNEVRPSVQTSPGHLDWHLVRPIAELTSTYTVIIRFDTEENLRRWMASSQRQNHIERVRPLLAKDDEYSIRSGLDFWFLPVNAGIKVPVKWKQFLITWSAIFPLSLGVPLMIAPTLRILNFPNNRFVTVLLSTGVIVFLMTYVIMPHYSRIVRKWLFR